MPQLTWADTEDGPICTCGYRTTVMLIKGKPRLMCLMHTPEEGCYWPLPRERPFFWPHLSHTEISDCIDLAYDEMEAEE